MAWAFLVLQRWQYLGWRFGASRMHLGPSVAGAAVRSRAVVLLLFGGEERDGCFA